MSLPPALLARLAQRGLVQKQKLAEPQVASIPAENEEVIAEDYDEMETDDKNTAEEYQSPPQYDHDDGILPKRAEDNFWADRMRTRMGEASSYAGYRGCPNKYNIWHKCTLFCVNRWAEGIAEPTREYMRRYKRLLRKYPLPKGWTELYDQGSATYYFYSAADNLVSWLPPTHPKSILTKSAATLRRKLEETGDPEGGSDSDYNSDEEEEIENAETRHQREIDDIISASMRPRSPTALVGLDYPTLNETANNAQASRKQKSRDLERTLLRQKREKDRDRERERDRDRHDNHSTNSRRHGRRPGNDDILDPMDPSAYSDTPRGKWSDGLQTGDSERKKSSSGDAANTERSGSIRESERERKKHDELSDDENNDDDEEEDIHDYD